MAPLSEKDALKVLERVKAIIKQYEEHMALVHLNESKMYDLMYQHEVLRKTYADIQEAVTTRWGTYALGHLRAGAPTRKGENVKVR